MLSKAFWKVCKIVHLKLMRLKQLGANKIRPTSHAHATLMSHALKASHCAFLFLFLLGFFLECGKNEPPRLDKRLMSKHLNSHKTFVHFPITLSFGGSKGLCSPSPNTPIAIYKPSFEFERPTYKRIKKIN
jgi:hypothetical protein